MAPETGVAIVLAFLLDLVLGDPQGFPHPVRAIGWLAAKLETIMRRLMKPFTAGFMVTLMVVSTAFGFTFLLVQWATLLHPTAGFTLEVFIIYTTLSARSLCDESRPVSQALQTGDLVAARKSLSRIVGRNTEQLNEKQITRATVETISENYVDGILAPLVFACLGGAPLAMAYKAVNTLDSMFGYRNKRYREFGTFPARLDDCANWIPARLSAVILPLATSIAGHNGWRALTTALRDGRNHLSPNSGFPEAAMAGALGIQLGGPSNYQGELVQKQTLGDSFRNIEQFDIQRSQKIMLIASILAVMFLGAASWMFHF